MALVTGFAGAGKPLLPQPHDSPEMKARHLAADAFALL
jgi:hypothetical protein